MGPFGCLTEFGAKRAELVQKFVSRSRVGIFLNERTRSTPMDPKLMFWYVSYYLGAFGAVWLPYESLCEMGRTSAKVRATPLDPKLMFWCISYYFGALETVWFSCETRCTMGRTCAKVRATKSRRKFLQRSHPIQPFDPKLTFWCVSYRLGAFGTVWLRYETRCKTGRTSAKVRPMKSRRNLSQRTLPIKQMV